MAKTYKTFGSFVIYDFPMLYLKYLAPKKMTGPLSLICYNIFRTMAASAVLMVVHAFNCMGNETRTTAIDLLESRPCNDSLNAPPMGESKSVTILQKADMEVDITKCFVTRTKVVSR